MVIVVMVMVVVGAAIATNSIMTAEGTRRCMKIEGEGRGVQLIGKVISVPKSG